MSFGGGSSNGGSLSGSTDVAFSNPEDSQLIAYNTSIAKWQNRTFDTITKYASHVAAIKSDGRRVRSTSWSASSTTVTNTAFAPFTQADVGKLACVYTDTTVGVVTTITSVQSSSQITLADAPGINTGGGAYNYIVYGSDDTAALQAYFNAVASDLTVYMGSGANAPAVTGQPIAQVPAKGEGIICLRNTVTVPEGVQYDIQAMLYNFLSDRGAPYFRAKSFTINRGILRGDALFGNGFAFGTSASDQAHTKLGDLEMWHHGDVVNYPNNAAFLLQGNHHEVNIAWIKTGRSIGFLHDSAPDCTVQSFYAVGVRRPIVASNCGNCVYNDVRFDTCGTSDALDPQNPVFGLELYDAAHYWTVKFTAFALGSRQLNALVGIGQNTTDTNTCWNIRVEGSAAATGGDIMWIDRCRDSTFNFTATLTNYGGIDQPLVNGIVYGTHTLQNLSIDATLPAGLTPYTGTKVGVFRTSQDAATVASGGSYGSLTKKPLPADFPAAAGVIAALLRGQRSTVIHAVGDSTTVGVNAWFAALGKRLGQAFPGYTVLHRSYSAANDQYNPPTQLQAGTLNGGGTRGMRLSAGGPFSYQMATAITGDLDVRVKVALDSWSSGSNQVLAAQWYSANSRVFSFQVNGSGSLGLGLSTDGTTALTTVSSTANPSVSNGGTLWVRATLDADNGSSGRTVTFYTSSDGSTWTQLGSTVTVSGAISLYNGNPPITLGLRYTSGSFTDRGVGTYYWVEVRNGINGPSWAPPLIDSWDFITSSDETGYSWVGAPVILLVNGGIGGQNISYFLDPVRKDVLHQDHGADMFMLNDSHNEGQLSRQSWVNTLSNYVNVVKTYMPGRPIVLVGQNPVNPAFFSASAMSKRYARVQSEATWAASQTGVYYVDSFLGFTNLANQLSSSDGLHPTGTDTTTDGTAGYQVWADALYYQMFAASLGPFDNPFLP